MAETGRVNRQDTKNAKEPGGELDTWAHRVIGAAPLLSQGGSFQLGLLINFNVMTFRQGLRRVIWNHRDLGVLGELGG